jgi:hypothetical protein
MEELIPIVVPVAFFACLVGLLWVALLYRHRGETERQQTLRAMVEKGVEIPPDFLTRRRTPDADLRRGLILLLGGLGTLLFLLAFTGRELPRLWTVALIPISVGGAFLVFWRLEQRRALSRV